MNDTEVQEAVVADLTQRLNDGDEHSKLLLKQLEQASAEAQQKQQIIDALMQENNALRARLTAVALVIRP